MISRAVRRLGLAALGATAAVVVVPDVLRLDRRLPMIATVAWRPQAVVGTAVAASVLAVAGPPRRAGAVLGAVAAAGAAAVVHRASIRSVEPASRAPVTVLSANVFTGRADTGALAALIGREKPDFVVLPEAGCDFLDKLLPLVADLGYRGWAATEPGAADIRGVVLLAGPRTGALEVQPGRGLLYRHVRATGGLLGARTLFAVHTAAPRTPRLAARWRRDLALIGRWTRTTPAPIVAGDFNATLDNAPLRAALGGCVPAARGRRALTGTYPAHLPRWFGIGIDHVLVPAGTTAVGVDVHDVAGSDHRAVVARFRLPDPAVADPALG